MGHLHLHELLALHALQLAGPAGSRAPKRKGEGGNRTALPERCTLPPALQLRHGMAAGQAHAGHAHTALPALLVALVLAGVPARLRAVARLHALGEAVLRVVAVAEPANREYTWQACRQCR